MEIENRKKRIFSVLCVYDNIIVKSYGFKKIKPAGSIITALKNLESWSTDEIIILDISRKNKINKKIIPQILASGISTPVSYGGGIRNLDDIKYLLDWNVDRFIIETEFRNYKLLSKIKDSTGSQSLIRCISFWDKSLGRKKYINSIEIDDIIKSFNPKENFFSEILLYDTQADGNLKTFNSNILNIFPKNMKKNLILMGGVRNSDIKYLCKNKNVVGLAYSNNNLEKEINIYNLRKEITNKFRGLLCRNV